MRFISCLFILFSISFSIYAQSINNNYSITSIDEVPLLKLPPLDNFALQKRYKPISKSAPLRFAEPRDIFITPRKDGLWESAGHKRIWRQRISSPNAETLNLGFTKFKLTPSAQLFIYGIDQEEILGPLTINDNDDHLQYWTPIIANEEIVIELIVDATEKDDILLEVSKVNHDFVDIRKSFSGSCNLDVVCGANDGWEIVDDYRDIIKSVGAYTISGIDACSGALINNARQDGTPYFLTANHCDISNGNAVSVVVFWNYENSICRQPNSAASGGLGDGLRSQTNSGAILRSSNFTSDFALIELDDPIKPEYDLHYAGWSLEPPLQDTMIGVHHPGVEEKRISFDFNRPQFDSRFQDTTHVVIMDWDIGTTEGGSSGSPIFNKKKQIVGQLEGGGAACGNNESDFYGWIGYSWEKGGVATNSLKPWLDPDDTGIREMQGRGGSVELEIDQINWTICGRDQNEISIQLQPQGLFENMVTYSVASVPSELDATFDFNTSNPGSTNFLTLTGFNSLSDLAFTILITVSDGINSDTKPVNISTFGDVPNPPRTNFPSDGAQLGSNELELRVARNNSENRFQVALDENFTDIVQDGTVNSNQIDLDNSVSENNTYYWRVKTSNPCGESDWTETLSFTVAPVYCTKLYARDIPIEIGDGSNVSINSILECIYPIQVGDLNIPNIVGKHDFVEDLVVELEFNGESVVLFSEVCGSNNDFDLGFDDDALLSEIPCPPVTQEIFKPIDELATFNGALAGGSWNLNIADLAELDGGVLEAWQMEICFSNAQSQAIIPLDHQVRYCNNKATVFEAFVESGNITDYNVQLVNPLGLVLSSTYNKLNDNLIEVVIEEGNELSDGNYGLLLVDNNNSNTLFGTTIDLINSTNTPSASIVFPANGSQITAGGLDEIEWAANGFSGDFLVEISSDLTFDNPVLSERGNNANSILVNGSSLPNGIYYVRVGHMSQDCGFIYSETVRFQLGDSSSTLDQDQSNQFDIFPNPFNDRFTIKTEEINLNECQFQLIDVNGKKVSANINPVFRNEYNVDIDLQHSGVYFLEIRYKSELYRTKLVCLKQ